MDFVDRWERYLRNKKLFPVQKRALDKAEHALDNDDLTKLPWLCMSMGTGKTLTALLICQRLMERRPSSKKCVIVAPPVLLKTWAKEVREMFQQALPEFQPGRATGAEVFDGKCPFVFVSSGILRMKSPEKLAIDWREHVSLVIVDEAHHFTHTGTNMFKNLMRLVHGSETSSIRSRDPGSTKLPVLLMSGTPLRNSRDDYRALIALTAHPSVEIPSTLEAMRGTGMLFIADRIVTVSDAEYKQIVSATVNSVDLSITLTEQQTAMYANTITERRGKARIPDILRLKYILQHPLFYRAGVSTYRELLIALNQRKSSLTDEQKRLVQEEICKKDVSPVFDGVKHVIEEHKRTTKIVVFFTSSTCMKMFHMYLLAHGFSEAEIAMLHGVQPKATQNHNIEKFEKNETCRVILCNLRLAAEGLNFENAGVAIFPDSWWTPSTHEQAICRLIRAMKDAIDKIMKEVTVYRVVPRFPEPYTDVLTVEDAFHQLHAKKQRIGAFEDGMGLRYVGNALGDDVKEAYSSGRTTFATNIEHAKSALAAAATASIESSLIDAIVDDFARQVKDKKRSKRTARGGAGGYSDSGSESDSDGGSDSGSESSSDGGSDSGSESGSDGGSDSGSESGSDDGSDSGSESSSDGGSDSGSDLSSDDGSDSDSEGAGAGAGVDFKGVMFSSASAGAGAGVDFKGVMFSSASAGAGAGAGQSTNAGHKRKTGTRRSRRGRRNKISQSSGSRRRRRRHKHDDRSGRSKRARTEGDEGKLASHDTFTFDA